MQCNVTLKITENIQIYLHNIIIMIHLFILTRISIDKNAKQNLNK